MDEPPPVIAVADEPIEGSTRQRWLEMGGENVDRIWILEPQDGDTLSDQALIYWVAAAGMRAHLILLGRVVCKAFDVEPNYGHESGACVRCLAFPHPSGCNRLLNDSAFRRSMRAKLISFCRRARERHLTDRAETG